MSTCLVTMMEIFSSHHSNIQHLLQYHHQIMMGFQVKTIITLEAVAVVVIIIITPTTTAESSEKLIKPVIFQKRGIISLENISSTNSTVLVTIIVFPALLPLYLHPPPLPPLLKNLMKILTGMAILLKQPLSLEMAGRSKFFWKFYS